MGPVPGDPRVTVAREVRAARELDAGSAGGSEGIGPVEAASGRRPYDVPLSEQLYVPPQYEDPPPVTSSPTEVVIDPATCQRGLAHVAELQALIAQHKHRRKGDRT